MLIRSEFQIEFNLPQEVPMIGLLRLHPSLDGQVRFPEALVIEHVDEGGKATELPLQDYVDSFGNRCTRFVGPQGHLRVRGENLTEAEGVPDPIRTEARQHPVEELPAEVLQYLAEQPLLPGRFAVAGSG